MFLILPGHPQPLAGVLCIDWSNPQRSIFQNFCKYAAEAKHDTGAKLSIPCEADDQLALSIDHFLDSNSDKALRPCWMACVIAFINSAAGPFLFE